MGVMLLVLTPVPYVDASAAWASASKWQRIVVGAAGMLVELFLAAIALFVWLAAEPGLVQRAGLQHHPDRRRHHRAVQRQPAAALRRLLHPGRLAGDPQPAAAGHRYLGYLCERYLFGRQEAERRPSTAPGERAWFVVYARDLVRLSDLGGGRHPAVPRRAATSASRVLFAAVTAVGWLGVPVAKGLGYFASSPRLRDGPRAGDHGDRPSSSRWSARPSGSCPVPLPEPSGGRDLDPRGSPRARRRTASSQRVVAKPGTRVSRGDSRSSCCATRRYRRGWRSWRRGAPSSWPGYDAAMPSDRVKARDRSRGAALRRRGRLAEARRRCAELTVRARADGTFVVAVARGPAGPLRAQGRAARLRRSSSETVTVRAVVPQDAIDLVRHARRGSTCGWPSGWTTCVPAVIRRVVPGASEQLPTTALGTAGGGQLAVDPRDRARRHGHGACVPGRRRAAGQAALPQRRRARLRPLRPRPRAAAASGTWRLRQLFLARFNV